MAGDAARLVDEQDAGRQLGAPVRCVRGVDALRDASSSRSSLVGMAVSSRSIGARVAVRVLVRHPQPDHRVHHHAVREEVVGLAGREPGLDSQELVDLEEAVARGLADHRVGAEHERVHEAQQQPAVAEQVDVRQPDAGDGDVARRSRARRGSSASAARKVASSLSSARWSTSRKSVSLVPNMRTT